MGRVAEIHNVTRVDVRTDPRPGVTVWPVRVLATVQLVAVLAQPMLAGLYLSGDFDALGLHSANAVLIEFLALLLLVAALGYWLGGQGRGRVPAAAAVGLVAVVLQAGFGYSRELALHVPLGVTVVLASVLATYWVWRPGVRVPRRSWRRGGGSR